MEPISYLPSRVAKPLGLSEALPNDLILNGAIGLGVLRSSFNSRHGHFSQRLANPVLEVHYCHWMSMRPTVRHSIYPDRAGGPIDVHQGMFTKRKRLDG